MFIIIAHIEAGKELEKTVLVAADQDLWTQDTRQHKLKVDNLISFEICVNTIKIIKVSIPTVSLYSFITYPAHPSLLQPPNNHVLLPSPNISFILYNWNHTVYTLGEMISYTQNDYFDIHSCCSKSIAHSLLLLSSIPLNGCNTINLSMHWLVNISVVFCFGIL